MGRKYPCNREEPVSSIDYSDNLKSIVPEWLAVAEVNTGSGIYTMVGIENYNATLIPEVKLVQKYSIWVGNTRVTEKNLYLL